MKRLLLVLLACVGLPSSAAAHERWVRHELLEPFDRSWFRLDHGPTLLVLLAVVGIVVGALWIGRRAQARPPVVSGFTAGPPLLGAAVGVTLVALALQGCFLAPDLPLGEGFGGMLLKLAALALGVGLAVGAAPVLLSAALALSFLAAACWRPFAPFDGAEVGLRHVLAYVDVLGMAAFLLLHALAKRGASDLRATRLRSAAAAVLRIGLGANLVFLGVEKFLQPQLFVAVVQNYPQVFHDPFRPLAVETIALGASAVEVLLGCLLLVGAFPRTVALVLAVVFTSTMGALENEVLGHLPLLASALILLLGGPGAVADLRAVVAGMFPRRPRPAAGRMKRTRPRPVGLQLPLGAAALTLALAAGGLDGTAHAGAGGSQGGARSAAAGILSEHLQSAQVVGEAGEVRFLVEFGEEPLRLQGFFTLRTRAIDLRTGEPLADARLEVDVTMPDHGHGMTTAPRTVAEGPGRFLTSGCKLHMPGTWEVSLLLYRDDELLDRAALPLILIAPHAP